MTVDTALAPAEPPWSKPPVDVNDLRPRFWSRTAERGPDGVLHVGGVSTVDLAGRFGTAAYLFDEADFVARCHEFRTAFHDFDIYYAGKAFLCKTVARLVARAGLGLDVCTGGELAVALAAGFPAERIVLHGNNKSAHELHRALRYGVGRIVLDSFDEIDALTDLAREYRQRPRVLVRATVGVRADTHDHIATAHEDQKFGFSVAAGTAAAAVRRVLDDGVLELRGLHTHIGSQIFDTSGWDVAARRALALHAAIGAEYGAELPEFVLGGGFGIAYTDADSPSTPGRLAAELRGIVADECAKLSIAVPRTAIEPGRAIAGPAGCTLYRVGTVKRLDGLRTYVSVDGGMSDNIRPALYDARYSVTLASRTSSAAPALTRVVGRHCDAGDIVVPDDHLPADIRVGDLIAVPGTGAYCRSLANNFNHTPRPPVIAVANGEARVIIRRETETDLLALDMG
ncbi:diaminopimelate decarboxylase [Streptomyces sp. W16]|uniref:diaminopimelate decarboxylase n=1 Tax=Streptomyces sp. W16 TaxID=3076631 RepID=UPI00295B788C|nr:diaminopimelate decarboxylase [Streptomyces sp. W16]MDV9178121.1 diaminopimelate decarboxylase [Streptomyces sp. W16]